MGCSVQLHDGTSTEYRRHDDINYIFTLFSMTSYIDDCYVVTIYADKDLSIEVHREYSSKLPSIDKDLMKSSSEYANAVKTRLHVQKNTLEVALLRAREKISERIVSLALKYGDEE